MIKTLGLTHININVRDLKRSLKFYQEAFGLRVMFKEGEKMVFLNTPGAQDTITLQEVDAPHPVGGGGVSHFGFRLANKADLDLAAAEVERAGGKVLRRGEHGPGHPYMYIADPDGYVIEL
jgi:catechol 2,3-dioxygenase-like lactoylglutathione lyase family enzyme